MRNYTAEIKRGDCLNVLADYPENTFDLIVTSPPYADRRKNTYGGIAPEKYVDWFIPRSKQFFRVLKPTGTFILNIKEKAENGERHTFVLELILALRKQGWLWTEEFIWHKRNCYPGKWPNRFRDAWERCLQFNNSSQIKKMIQNFSLAKRILRTNASAKNIVAVNGCCYGQEAIEDKGDYVKKCGQSFWSFISGDDNLYINIIEPLGHRAKEQNEAFQAEYSKVVNRFTGEFIKEFCRPDGAIIWDKLVRFNSGLEKE